MLNSKIKFPIRKSFTQKSSLSKKSFAPPPPLNIAYVYQDLIAGLEMGTRSKYQVPCFYHDDEKPSMTLYLKTNTFFCFTCHKWGGPYDIIMQIKKMTFPHAIEYGKNYL